MRLVLLCTPDAVEGEFCLPEVPEMTRCMLLYMLEVQRCGGWVLFAGRVGRAGDAGDDIRCTLLCMLLEVLEVLEVLDVMYVPEVIGCVLLSMPEAVEGGLCLLEVPEMTRCVLFYM